MKPNGSMSLMVQAARQYHEQKLTQPEIAQQLGVSQSRVSRWLKEAEAQGIVRTVVVAPEGVYPDLEELIRDRFGLRHVIVADVRGDERMILPALGSAAAMYLESTLADGARIGISSYSASLMAAVQAMSPLKKRRASKVVQVMGGLGLPGAQIIATQTADRLARLTGAAPVFLPTPGIVSNPATREALMKDDVVGNVAAEWPYLTDLILGIGSLAPSPLLQSSGNAISEAEIDQLRALGAVGDVAMHFLDIEGAPVRSDLEQRVVGIGATDLARVPRRIAIAGGARKLQAILAALRSGHVNVLITDADTAESLGADPAPPSADPTDTVPEVTNRQSRGALVSGIHPQT